MYIESLRVRNVRLLAKQEFSFVNADGSPRMWTVIVGENGVCKSTILQAIALAAMGPKLGSAIVEDAQRLRNLSNDFAASATAVFVPSTGNIALFSSFSIEPDRFDLTPGDFLQDTLFLDELRARRQSNWFIVGYGVGRFIAEPGETVLPKDPTVERIRGLFSSRHKILGINFHNAFHSKALARRFSRYLGEILKLGGSPSESLLPGLHDLDLEGYAEEPDSRFGASSVELWLDNKRLKLPAIWLSDGYQAMLSWIADLLGHAFLELGDSTEPQDLQGIVLLDEIDLHLHPTWQRRIVPLLRKIFPKLQFIVNTHSPLVLASFEREEIIQLKFLDGEVVQDPAPIEPGVLTASEILSNFFDIQRAGRPDLIQKERRYLELQAKKRLAPKERDELRDLARDLERYLVPSTSVETEILSPEEILKRKT